MTNTPSPTQRDRNFLDAAVVYLNEHWAHIAEILTDQWSLVEVVRRRYNPDTKDLETILVLRIQCDRVEPSYVRAILGGQSEGYLLDNVGDASCCSLSQTFDYDHVVTLGPFQCLSERRSTTSGGLSLDS